MEIDEIQSLARPDLSGQQDDDDFQDLGFFNLKSKSPETNGPQDALNELGLNPSPPRYSRVLSNDMQGSHLFSEDNGEPFDFDRELELEEMLRQEEQSQPTPYDEEEEEFVMEAFKETERDDASNATDLLSSSPILTPPPITKKVATITNAEEQQSRSSSSRSNIPQLPPRREPVIATSSRIAQPQPALSAPELEEEELGVNGLPKYIPAGLVHTILLDGTEVRFERRKRVTAWKPKPAHYGAGPTGLLSRPVHQIVDRVEAMRALQVVKDNEGTAHRVKPVKKTPEMWQERYRPSRFTELIGEERTHRDVMTWLKSWDKCVFGKQAGKKRFREAQPPFNGAPMSSNFVKDKWDRPRERILLLGGPAGMGKTTLAHVAAKAAGYHIHEINASDERSARTVEDRVKDALESNSLHNSSNRKQPTCLVLDEVDGATGGANTGGDGLGGGFIRALIKLVRQGASETEGEGSSSKKQGGKKGRPLLRPIICVCNDPYAPSLRALRPHSKLVRLNRPSTPALMSRLRQICEQESIRHDTAGLNLLISLCQGDLRSCLNALQLVQSDSRGLTAATLQGDQGDPNDLSIVSALSIKDGNSNIHQVWMKLLRTHTSREKDRQRGAKIRAKNTAAGAESDETNEVVSSVISSGEMDKILAGCFEHYTNLKLVDDGWWRFRKMHDWIHWYEHLNQRGWELGVQNEMYSYLPWSFACWRQLFANTANLLPEYPRTDYQNYLKRTAFDEVTIDLQNCLPLSTRSQFDKNSLVTELGPMLVPLLSPDLKPINAQVVQVEEKRKLASCVSLMNTLNIDFIMDKNEQGHSYYKFDPPLEAFAHFEGKRVAENTGVAARFNVRQMITAELRALRLREKQTNLDESASTRKSKKEEEPKPKEAPKKVKGAVDFFGRPIVAKQQTKSLAPLSGTGLPQSILARRQEKENLAPLAQSANQNDFGDVFEPALKKAKLKVFYHYHEGYSNAVRKPIKMSDLLS